MNKNEKNRMNYISYTYDAKYIPSPYHRNYYTRVGKGGGGANGPHNIYARGAWPPQNNMFAHVHRHLNTHASSAQA